jgi:hypothetical protein
MQGSSRRGLAGAGIAEAVSYFPRGRYRTHVDESGNHHLSAVNLRDQANYLGITGVITEESAYRHRIRPGLDKVRREHFDGERVHFHRDDIVKKRGPFSVLQDSRRMQEFGDAMLGFYAAEPYTVISVVIDKEKHVRTYRERAYEPYEWAFALVLERYCKFLIRKESRGDVLAESRDKPLDRKLAAAWRRFYDDGIPLGLRGEAARKVLTSKDLHFETKDSDNDGLQVADMLAFPCKWDVLVSEKAEECFSDPFSPRVADAIGPKYHRCPRTGQISGWGRYLIVPPRCK